MNLLWVFIGGGLGSLLRYAFGLWLRGQAEAFPWPTFAANLLSCLLLGLLAGYAVRHDMPLSWRLLLLTGFCGGFSTFSTFSLETFQLLQLGRQLAALTYVVVSLLSGLLGIVAGWGLSKWW